MRVPLRQMNRAADKLLHEFGKYFNYDTLTGAPVVPVQMLTKIGSQYGGRIIPTDRLTRDSICYCVGVGEDITFDLGLIEQFHCQVFAYDPTPRAVQHVKTYAATYPTYIFESAGVWGKDEVVKFYAPANPDNVSYSALNLQKTATYFEAQCKTIKTLMREHGHQRLDLLKLDVEGAEYEVIDSLLADQIDIHILCVEYDEVFNPLDVQYKERIRRSVARLLHYGYVIVALDAKGNYTFVKSTAPRVQPSGGTDERQ